jgi:hypothetical protein
MIAPEPGICDARGRWSKKAPARKRPRALKTAGCLTLATKGERLDMAVQQMDTTKNGVVSYLKDAAETRKAKPQSGDAMRLAVFRFICDMLDVTDKETRKAAWKQFDATPGWFGCNASAARQAMGIKSDVEQIEADFDA